MPPGSTRDRLLVAARRLFDRGGVDAVSVRQVAARVGITPMAVYRHYADREALIDAIVLDALDAWAERVAAIEVEEPLAWLSAACDAFLEFALGEPRRFEAAFLVPSARARRIPDDFAAGRSPAGRLWLPRLEALARDGRLAADTTPLEVAISVWALAQGLVTLYRAGRFTGDARDFRAFHRRSVRRCLASFVDAHGSTATKRSARRGQRRTRTIARTRGRRA
jgi:AcrR family transcriptional regulator